MRLPLKSELGSIDKVNVPSAAIHISGKLTGFQRKAWMCFFAVTRTSSDEATHSCQVKDLITKSGYGSTNLKRLREELKPLTVTPVSWDIFDKEETIRMGDSQMIADIEFIPGKGIVEWSFSPKLKRLLLTDLKMYLQVNFSFLPDLRGHEVAIYLNVNDYINKKTNFGKKYVSVPQAKDMLGLDEDEYSNPGDLLRLLKRNIAKINKKSDIDVTIEEKKGARNKIEGFMLSGRVKEEYLDFYRSGPISLPTPGNEQEPAQRSILYLLSTEVKEKLDSWDFVFYPDVLEALERLIQAPYEFQSHDINEYLLFLVNKIEKQAKKNESQGIKGNPGGLLKHFIASGQHLDAFILKNKEQQVKDAEKREQEKNAQNLQYEQLFEEFKRIHAAKNLDAFIEYLKADLERFSPLLEKIATDDYALRVILKGQNLTGVLRAETPTRSLRTALLNYQEQLGFSPQPFEAQSYLENPEYEALRSKHLKESKVPV